MHVSLPSTIVGVAPLTVELSGDLPAPQALRAVLEHRAQTGEPLTYRRLHSADLTGANLDGLNLEHCDLPEVDMTGASLVGAKLLNCNLARVKAEGVDLSGATLQVCDLTEADFTGAMLEKAALIGCCFRFAKMVDIKAAESTLGGRTTGSNWTGADLSWAEVYGLEGRDHIVRQQATGTGTLDQREALLYFMRLRAGGLNTRDANMAEAKRWLAAVEGGVA